jgi:nitrogen fixation-related uncharacterized protein
MQRRIAERILIGIAILIGLIFVFIFLTSRVEW